MTKSQKTLEALYKEIGALDHKKKALMRELKTYPAYSIGYITDAIKGKMTGAWYVRTDHQGIPMSVDNKDKVIRYSGYKVEDQKSNVKSINQNIYNVTMTIENLQGVSYTKFIQVSVDRPIVPQIWSNMIELSPAQLRKIEIDIKKLEVEQKKTAKIKELEDMIAKASAELAKLKK